MLLRSVMMCVCITHVDLMLRVGKNLHGLARFSSVLLFREDSRWIQDTVNSNRNSLHVKLMSRLICLSRGFCIERFILLRVRRMNNYFPNFTNTYSAHLGGKTFSHGRRVVNAEQNFKLHLQCDLWTVRFLHVLDILRFIRQEEATIRECRARGGTKMCEIRLEWE